MGRRKSALKSQFPEAEVVLPKVLPKVRYRSEIVTLNPKIHSQVFLRSGAVRASIFKCLLIMR